MIGGRTDAYAPTNLVQKYYVYGFGSEDVTPWDVIVEYQATGNQTDIWSPHFLRPDTDQYPDPDVDPQIRNRTSGSSGGEGVLPTLPVPVYGLMAVAMETKMHQTPPSFPNGPFRYIFTFGGIDESGQAIDEMRWWDTSRSQEETPNVGEEEGVFSLVSNMPTPRAYGKAVVIPDIGELKIALVGGIDENNAPLNTVDIYTFENSISPTQGSWETFGGDLPEALVACGAGYNPGVSGEEWLLTFGGWNGEDYTDSTYNVRIGSPGDLVIREPLKVIPRGNIGSCQAGSDVLAALYGISLTYNRYYLFAGADENGADSIVEVVSLP